MKRLLVVVSVIVGSGAIGRTAPAEAASLALSDFVKPGIVWQDRNGDGAVDFVDARIVLPDAPTSGELAAAADVGARLGYETSAMNLPIGQESGASIFIGAKSLPKTGVTVAALGATGLRAGDGFVGAFAFDGKPAVAILGADEAGLTAAAVMFAGHLPYIWDQKSATTSQIADDVRDFLSGKGVKAVTVVAPAILVHDRADGVDRVNVDVQLAGGGDLVKAQVALNQFKAAPSRDPKRALSYANVRDVRIRLHAAGSGVATIDLPKAAAPETAATQPPARRPGGAAKDTFDLSSFYANEGALADSDNNLIPDRVDVLLSSH